ncbi:MAG: hypothetical protein ACOC1S_05265, partial [bacterium]
MLYFNLRQLLSKKIIILAIVMISLIVVGNKISFASDLDNFEIMAENNHLTLYLNNETTEIAVQKKDTGEIWFSNPQDINEMEQIRRGSSKDQLKSQISIEYYTDQDNKNTMDNYNDSIDYGQYEIEKLEKGVKINYSLGKEWSDESFLPDM